MTSKYWQEERGSAVTGPMRPRGGGEGRGGGGRGGLGERGTAREGRREGGERVGVFRGDNLSEDHDDPLWTQGMEEYGVEETVGQKRDRGWGGVGWGGKSCQLPQGKVECESAHLLKSLRPSVIVCVTKTKLK